MGCQRILAASPMCLDNRGCASFGFGGEMPIVECAAVADLRGRCPYNSQAQQTVQQSIWQPKQLQVANISIAGMNEVGPTEGPNNRSARLAGMLQSPRLVLSFKAMSETVASSTACSVHHSKVLITKQVIPSRATGLWKGSILVETGLFLI